MENNLFKILEEIGLKDHEVSVYLAALELGESTVLPIADKAGVKRTYCYDILADLQAKHLVSFQEKNGRRRYMAEDPKNLELLLKERLHNFSQVLPDLRAIYNKPISKPKMRYFEGKEGIISVYDALIKAKPKSFDAISSPNHIGAYLGGYFLDHIGKVVANKIKAREIIHESGKDAEYLKLYKAPDQQYRELPATSAIGTDTILYNDRLVMISYTNDFHAVMIESSAIVETQKALFEILWNSSKSA